ncbi:MAG: hypothetical protein GY842_00805 [bacterium]|nr:hypothetical protein [bacterium]
MVEYDDAYEAMMEVDHGPLGYFGMYDVRDAVREMLARLLESRREKDAFLHEPPNFGEYTGDVCADVACQATFADAAFSQAAVAGIAPLFETLLKNAAEKLREAWAERPLPEHPNERWNWKGKKFWNPKLFRTDNGRKRESFREGTRQFLESLGHDDVLNSFTGVVFEALFEYRNAMLHEGYVWSKATLDKFCAARLDRKAPHIDRRMMPLSDDARCWGDWFQTCECDGQPWMITVTDRFAHDALLAVEDLARSLRHIESALRANSQQ